MKTSVKLERGKHSKAGYAPRLLLPSIEIGDNFWWKRTKHGIHKEYSYGAYIRLVWWDYFIGLSFEN